MKVRVTSKMFVYKGLDGINLLIYDSDNDSIESVLPCIVCRALDCGISILDLPNLSILFPATQLGETLLMNNGLYATRIKCINSDLSDFQFETGIIQRNIFNCVFNSKSLSSILVLEDSKRSEILGERRQMQSGYFATCIGYVNNRDITIQFDDGLIRGGVTKASFIHRNFTNPNCKSRFSLDGVSKLMKCGQIAECIADNGCYNITVRFDDGAEVKTSRGSFRKGSVANPNLGAGNSEKLLRGLYGIIKDILFDLGKSFDSDFDSAIREGIFNKLQNWEDYRCLLGM